MSLEKICKELEAWKLKAEVNFELAEGRAEKLSKIQEKLEKLKVDAGKEIMRILTNGPLPNPQVNYLQGQLDTIQMVLEALG